MRQKVGAGSAIKMHRLVKDMLGKTAGDRTAIEYLGDKRWLTVCVCGRRIAVDGADFRRNEYQCNHDPALRFWRYVNKTNGCWEWMAYRCEDGYGKFRANRRLCLAHRFAWQLKHGPVPNGLELDHLCRNRACVNPEHLEPVTHHENVKRGRLGEVTRERYARRKAA